MALQLAVCAQSQMFKQTKLNSTRATQEHVVMSLEKSLMLDVFSTGLFTLVVGHIVGRHFPYHHSLIVGS